MASIAAWAADLVVGIQDKRLPDFSGFGLVVYCNNAALPVHPLVPSRLLPPLPISGLEGSIQLVGAVSRLSSICHDGFYLVRSEDLAFTHVSQFLSPGIPSVPIEIEIAGGARQMAARLASLISDVEATVVCSASFETVMYTAGSRKLIFGAAT